MKIQAHLFACRMVKYVGLALVLHQLTGCRPKSKPVTAAPPPPARSGEANATTPEPTTCVLDPTTNVNAASLTQIQSMAQRITDDEMSALSNAQKLAALNGAELLKEVVRDPQLWQRLPDDNAKLNWAVTVFYRTYPDSVTFAMPALLMLTNSRDLAVAGRASFVVGVSQMRSGDYETARRTLAAAMERQLGSQTLEEAARSMNSGTKRIIDRLLKARAILAAKAQWTQDDESELYWLSARFRLYSESANVWNLHADYAHALMNTGRRAEAIDELEKALSLMGNQSKDTYNEMQNRLQSWKEGGDESEAYDL